MRSGSGRPRRRGGGRPTTPSPASPTWTWSSKAGEEVRIFERTAAGDEHDWGQITHWEPPHRIVYRWHLRVDRKDATEVEVRFVDRGAATTVEIEHRGWERLGTDGQARRDANGRGWATLLPHFVDAVLPRPR